MCLWLTVQKVKTCVLLNVFIGYYMLITISGLARASIVVRGQQNLIPDIFGFESQQMHIIL